MAGGFTFASEVLLGRIARFYGLSIPEAERDASLADLVGARLPRDPTLGDGIRFESIELVVREMNGAQITTIGLDLRTVVDRRCGRGRAGGRPR
jgi:potassium/hydrogen antiporter